MSRSSRRRWTRRTRSACASAHEALTSACICAASARPSRRRSTRGSPRTASSPSRSSTWRATCRTARRCASTSSTCRRRRCRKAASSTASTSREAEMWREELGEPRPAPRCRVRRRRRSRRGRGALGALHRRCCRVATASFVELPLARGKVVIGTARRPGAPAGRGAARAGARGHMRSPPASAGESGASVKLPPSLGGVWVIS